VEGGTRRGGGSGERKRRLLPFSSLKGPRLWSMPGKLPHCKPRIGRKHSCSLHTHPRTIWQGAKVTHGELRPLPMSWDISYQVPVESSPWGNVPPSLAKLGLPSQGPTAPCKTLFDLQCCHYHLEPLNKDLKREAESGEGSAHEKSGFGGIRGLGLRLCSTWNLFYYLESSTDCIFSSQSHKLTDSLAGMSFVSPLPKALCLGSTAAEANTLRISSALKYPH
jgi:hypothetical protein